MEEYYIITESILTKNDFGNKLDDINIPKAVISIELTSDLKGAREDIYLLYQSKKVITILLINKKKEIYYIYKAQKAQDSIEKELLPNIKVGFEAIVGENLILNRIEDLRLLMKLKNFLKTPPKKWRN